jgi:formamidopyrimidine-DNA glycosylase
MFTSCKEMPEGPEATYISQYISSHFQGKALQGIDIVSGRYKNHGPPLNYSTFVKQLPLKCTSVSKKGKVIFIYFEGGWCLISKLGLSGWWYVPGDEPSWKPAKTSLSFKFANAQLIFSDMMSYGTLTITNDKAVISREIDTIALDILETKFANVEKRIQEKVTQTNKHWLNEDALVDQHFIVSGIGNYLKAEVLYGAKLSPLRTLESLSLKDWRAIYDVAKYITKKMVIVLRKQDIEKYMNSMKIYRKDVDPLGNRVVQHKTKGGRTTSWVPAVQH